MIVLGGVVLFIILAVILPYIAILTNLATSSSIARAIVAQRSRIDHAMSTTDATLPRCALRHSRPRVTRAARQPSSRRAGRPGRRGRDHAATVDLDGRILRRGQALEGAIHELWAKALALKDPRAGKAVLVTLDVCGIAADVSTPVRDAPRPSTGSIATGSSSPARTRTAARSSART